LRASCPLKFQEEAPWFPARVCVHFSMTLQFLLDLLMPSQVPPRPPTSHSQKFLGSSGNFWGPPWRASGGGGRAQVAPEAPRSCLGQEKGAARPRRASGRRQPPISRPSIMRAKSAYSKRPCAG
jgi:hypothetical protein